jgi:hypothetical protein
LELKIVNDYLSDPQELRKRSADDLKGSEDDVSKISKEVRRFVQLFRVRQRLEGVRQQVGQLLLVVRGQADGDRRCGRALEENLMLNFIINRLFGSKQFYVIHIKI